jgi:enterochelin esterase-like enzyme
MLTLRTVPLFGVDFDISPFGMWENGILQSRSVMPAARCGPLLLAHLALTVAACTSSPAPGSPGRAAAGSDPVDFIVLGRGSMADCIPRRHDVHICRIRDNVSIPEIRRRLASGITAWRDEDALVLAYEGKADAVDVTGTLEYPMSRVRGTDIWIVKLRVRDLDRAIVSHAIVPLGGAAAPASQHVVETWRGTGAPGEASNAATLKGRVVADGIDSRALGHSRAVHVYLPPGEGAPERVVYLGDGEAVRRLAPYIDTLITAGSLPRVMLVGVASAGAGPGRSPQQDPRALEYLWNYDTLNTRFLAHERFLLDEVMPWAESRHGAPTARERRAVFGMSNSGGWAMQMGLRNPDRFAHVIAFSPGGVRSGHMTPAMRFTPPVRFLLLAGTLEPVFNEVAKVWARELAERRIEHQMIEVVAGHDWNVWRDHAGEALEWAFGRAGP